MAILFHQSSPVASAENLMDDMNDLDDTPLIEDPWGQVADGQITMRPGTQPAVDDDGHINSTVFGPSVAVGDLNGDGLLDLVVADARGYFWFFPNSGTPKVPKFTTCEIMPIWLGDPTDANQASLQQYDYGHGNFDAQDNIVPRIQLVDYAGDKKLSLVVGNFEGKLFYVHNLGSRTQPAFTMPENLASITVDTYSQSHLWCNFLSPFLYDFTGNGQLDLIMGEGTYASNSIYRLVNKGSNGSPLFSELTTTKIIPGYGREHLTPQVVDWNNDGKPDIICGERQGYIDIFLNKSTDRGHLVFDNPVPPALPQRVKFGYTDQLGLLSTVTVGDLSGNGKPNLIISNSDQHVLYAVNKGKLGAPEFDEPQPIKATNPFPKIYDIPSDWGISKGFSLPYLQIACTNVKDDPTFTSPDGKIKSAIKVYTVPHTHTYFPAEIYPAEDTKTFGYGGFGGNASIAVECGVNYTVSFWIKSSGDVNNVNYALQEGEVYTDDKGGPVYRYIFVQSPVDGVSGSWTHFSGDVVVPRGAADKAETANVQFRIGFNGKGGTIWVTGFNMTKRDQQ